MNEYKKQPSAEFKATMDYKNENIRRFQDDKQEGMKIMSSGRDAVLIVSSQFKGNATEEMLKKEILLWRDWLYKNVYTMSDEKYKELNQPF